MAVREGAAVRLGLSQSADNTEAGVGATEAPGVGVMWPGCSEVSTPAGVEDECSRLQPPGEAPQ